MHLAPAQTSCALGQSKEMLSPCCGCMGFPNLWGKGCELLGYRQGRGEEQLPLTDPSVEHRPFQCLAALLLGNAERLKASGAAWSQSHCPCPAPSIMPDLPKGQQRPGTGLLLRGHQLCPAGGGTPWSQQVPSTAVNSTHLPQHLCQPIKLVALVTPAGVKEEHKQPGGGNASEKDSDPNRSLSV